MTMHQHIDIAAIRTKLASIPPTGQLEEEHSYEFLNQDHAAQTFEQAYERMVLTAPKARAHQTEWHFSMPTENAHGRIGWRVTDGLPQKNAEWAAAEINKLCI